MSSINKLSEKDELIKKLRNKDTDNKNLKESINKKLDILKGDKTVTK